MTELTHFDADGSSRMVNVGHKEITQRTARAEATVLMRPETLRIIQSGGVSKGDVLGTARLAGIMATKRTADLIPLCHPLAMESADLTFLFPNDHSIRVQVTVSCTAKTGVEMEALTAVTIASLTIYDMCKSADREMEITGIRLLEKTGGRSGHFQRPADTN